MNKYTTRTVAEIAGLNIGDIADYVRRDLLTVAFDPPVQGKPRLWSRESAIEFAMLATLSRMGMELSTAKALVGRYLPKLGTAKFPAMLIWNPNDRKAEVVALRDTADLSLAEAVGMLASEDGVDAEWTSQPDMDRQTHATPAVCVLDLNALVASVDRKLTGQGR